MSRAAQSGVSLFSTHSLKTASTSMAPKAKTTRTKDPTADQIIIEKISMNVSDLDLVAHKATVKTFKRKDHKREIFWDEETNDHLERWIDVRRQILDRSGRGCEALWLSLDTAHEPARVGKHAFEHLLLRLRKELGIEKRITPHSFRHGFGYRGTKANANIRHLQIMMGHAKLSTAQIYMGYKDKEVEEEYRRVMEVGKLTNSLTGVKYPQENLHLNLYDRRIGSRVGGSGRKIRQILYKEGVR